MTTEEGAGAVLEEVRRVADAAVAKLAETDRALRGWSKSYASACAVLRDPEARLAVLGEGALEFDEMGLMPTIGRKPVTPELISAMRERCELSLRDTKGRPIQFSLENLQGAVLQVARERSFHPVREYLAGLEWDRTERLAHLADAIGTAATPLNSSMLRKFAISAVARALNPGCKVDTTPILVGAQGIGKSRLFRALAGPYFADTPMTIGDKDSLLVLHAAWIHEWAELESVQRAARSQTVKAFLSSSEDVFRAPYDRTPRRYPRSCVIVGTTNDEEFLTDPTGGRRYWVLSVSKRIDVAAVEADRDQLWAEAVHAFRAGERWWLEDDQERALSKVQERHVIRDPWEDEILRFAEAARDHVSTAGILDALRVPAAQQTRANAMRVAGVLTRAGYSRRRATLSTGARAWVYVPRRRQKAAVIDLRKAAP